MKVLLINPIMEEEARFFPLGLGYVAQVLLDNGHQVSVLDINAHKLKSPEVEKKISASDCEVVGITALITQYPYVRWLIGAIKHLKPSVKVVVGGGLASVIPRKLLEQTEADVAVVGEGEQTARELFRVLDKRKPLKNVRGIWFRDGRKICQTEAREYIPDLDEIPFPARHLFPMDVYTKRAFMAVRTAFDSSVRATNILSARGCPYQCRYCFHGIYGRKFRARSAQNIAAEIKELKRRYGVNGVMFDDDTFVISRRRVMEFCDILIKENLNVVWACNGRANLMDKEMLEKMKEAGCRIISYGIESGNQQVLDNLDRRTTVGECERAIEMTWEAGIIPYAYLMIGAPNETRKSVQDTVDFCRRHKVGQGLGFITLFPNTPLQIWATEQGKAKDYDRLVEEGRLNPEELTINLTSIPDGELRRLKREAEYAIVGGAILARAWRIYRIVGLKAMFVNLVPLMRTSIPRKAFGGILMFFRRKRAGNFPLATGLRIVVLTRNDPINIPIYLEELARLRGSDVAAVVLVGIPQRSEFLPFLRDRFRVLGTWDALLRSVRVVLYAVMDWLCRIIGVRFSRFYSVRSLTSKYGIPLYSAENIKSGEFADFMRGLKPDIVVSVTCPRIIGKELLDMPRLGCINVHCSLLPRGKGRDPAFWALLSGRKRTGMTIHYMDEGMDNGDIIVQKIVPILPDDSMASLYHRIAEVSSVLLVGTLAEVENGTAPRRFNDSSKETVFGLPTREDVRRLKATGRKLTKVGDCFPFIIGRRLRFEGN